MTSKWKLIESKSVLQTIPFEVEELRLLTHKGVEPASPYHRLNSPEWVNVLPVLTDGRVMLISQTRVGPFNRTLETPGGVMEADERDPTMAVARELEEETGLVSQRILPLATINPNPAFMTNKVHLFVALGCMPNPSRKHFPDENEDVELCPTDAKDLDQMVRTGQINSCIAALTIQLAHRYVDIGATEPSRS